MMNLIALVIGIYLALVAASLTILVVATSKWYVKKINKMTKTIIEEYEEI